MTVFTNRPSPLVFPIHGSIPPPYHAASSPVPGLSRPSLAHAPNVSFSLSPTPTTHTKTMSWKAVMYTVSNLTSSSVLNTVIQGVPEKIAQSSCTTILQQYIMQFSAKCSERNCLHDVGQCLNMANKFSFFTAGK